ncbi:hypothetical protein ES707_15303 [subsurface metagenome]
MAKCSQCDKVAVVSYGEVNLCAEHYQMVQQADYQRFRMAAAMFNVMAAQFDAGTGWLVPHPRIEIPPATPSIVGNLTFNNISVDRSTVGAINLERVRNLDISIDIMQSRGDTDLAAGIKELTQAIIDSKEVTESVKDEINGQLEFLVAQATANKQNRNIGLIKSALAGIRGSISVVASLLAIWDKVEPLIKMYLGMG